MDFTIPIRCVARSELAGHELPEPVAVGVPFPRGMLQESDLDIIALFNHADESIDAELTALAKWPDGSVRWASCEWIEYGHADESLTLRSRSDEEPRSKDAVPVSLAAVLADSGSTIELGCERNDDAAKVVSMAVEFKEHQQSLASRTMFTDWRETHCGRLRKTYVASGYPELGDGELHVRVELNVYPSAALARIRTEITNPRPAAHPGGIWVLGDAGSKTIAAANLCLSLVKENVSRARCLVDGTWYEGTCTEVYQESSAGNAWDSPNHYNRNGAKVVRYSGAKLRVDDVEVKTLGRVSPLGQSVGAIHTVSVAPVNFWQTFPKALRVSQEQLTIGLLPEEWADAHELQGGERYAHESVVHISPTADDEVPTGANWVASPSVFHVDTDWLIASQAIAHFDAPRLDDDHAEFVNAVLDGPESFLNKRERIDEYGWRNFGDINADHEAAYHNGDEPFISHYNNQYDPLGSFALCFLRTGDVRWYRQMDELAAHLATVDRYHTNEDKWAYNGGMFWHTTHYVAAGLSTHRTYPETEGVIGGGPSTEHLYTHGLLLHHYLTGRAYSAEAVRELGDFVINADDGQKTPFRFVDRGPTGLVSCSGSMDYHGPGRGPGNAIDALLNTFELTAERCYLDKAEEIIRRCIHPDDDVGERNLGDVETRWFYMVFLKALLKFMDVKLSLGERDMMFHYARASLLLYLSWAVEHEYPYLDEPDILDFPNETWAAQEMRKADVFELAALYAPQDLATRFKARAKFFHRASIDGLNTFDETKFRARPLVLLLSFGWAHVGLRNTGVITPSELREEGGHFNWPPLSRFVRQKRRAVKRAAIIAVVGALICTVGLASLLFG